MGLVNTFHLLVVNAVRDVLLNFMFMIPAMKMGKCNLFPHHDSILDYLVEHAVWYSVVHSTGPGMLQFLTSGW